MSKKTYHFSGYATKNDLRCRDGRTIRKDAFKHNDGMVVPLVWQHQHNSPENVLGHALLENRSDGVYAYGTFNDTPSGKNAKLMVMHGDVVALSIYANDLKENGGDVLHGAIREVSLVLAGANPGARIDNLVMQHDGYDETIDNEAIIFSGQNIKHSGDDEDDEDDDEDDEDDEGVVEHSESVLTVKDVMDSMTEEQRNIVEYLVGEAIQAGSAEHSDDEGIEHSEDEGGEIMKKNIFDGTKQEENKELKHVFTADDWKAIIADATTNTKSLKASVIAHAATYGIENIDYMFPDAKTITNTPELISREMAWVSKFLYGAKHTPFTRIKTLIADITAEEARAKGYVKASLKTEEIVRLLKRVTTPTTIYKKQKLDRDDIIDIVDFDVVSWLKSEMRLMLDEEIARAGLIGDGRTAEDPDKINEENIRPIYKDGDMFVVRVAVDHDATYVSILEDIIRARKNYKGSGNPVMYTTTDLLTEFLLIKDSLQRRLYPTVTDLCSALRVSEIIEVEPMSGVTRETDDAIPVTMELLAILVNMNDYTYGADKGGGVSTFDDFDIDYNQYKYLIETRLSGCLTKPKSAMVIERSPAAAG